MQPMQFTITPPTSGYGNEVNDFPRYQQPKNAQKFTGLKEVSAELTGALDELKEFSKEYADSEGGVEAKLPEREMLLHFQSLAQQIDDGQLNGNEIAEFKLFPNDMVTADGKLSAEALELADKLGLDTTQENVAHISLRDAAQAIDPSKSVLGSANPDVNKSPEVSYTNYDMNISAENIQFVVMRAMIDMSIVINKSMQQLANANERLNELMMRLSSISTMLGNLQSTLTRASSDKGKSGNETHSDVNYANGENYIFDHFSEGDDILPSAKAGDNGSYFSNTNISINQDTVDKILAIIKQKNPGINDIAMGWFKDLFHDFLYNNKPLKLPADQFAKVGETTYGMSSNSGTAQISLRDLMTFINGSTFVGVQVNTVGNYYDLFGNPKPANKALANPLTLEDMGNLLGVTIYKRELEYSFKDPSDIEAITNACPDLSAEQKKSFEDHLKQGVWNLAGIREYYISLTGKEPPANILEKVKSGALSQDSGKVTLDEAHIAKILATYHNISELEKIALRNRLSPPNKVDANDIRKIIKELKIDDNPKGDYNAIISDLKQNTNENRIGLSPDLAEYLPASAGGIYKDGKYYITLEDLRQVIGNIANELRKYMPGSNADSFLTLQNSMFSLSASQFSSLITMVENLKKNITTEQNKNLNTLSQLQKILETFQQAIDRACRENGIK